MTLVEKTKNKNQNKKNGYQSLQNWTINPNQIFTKHNTTPKKIYLTPTSIPLACSTRILLGSGEWFSLSKPFHSQECNQNFKWKGSIYKNSFSMKILGSVYSLAINKINRRVYIHCYLREITNNSHLLSKVHYQSNL